MRQQLLIGRTVIACGMIRSDTAFIHPKTRVCAQSTRAAHASVRNSRNNVNGVEPPDRASVKTPRRDTASAQRAASNPAAHDATPSASARTYVSR